MRDFDPKIDKCPIRIPVYDTPRIVLSYHGEIRLLGKFDPYMSLEDIAASKIKYLEHFLGYKIEKLENIIPHDEYEKMHGKSIKNP